MTHGIGNLRHTVAGLLSTVKVNPSQHHPEMMLEMADQVIAMVVAWIDPAEYDDVDEEMVRGDIDADAVAEAAFERMQEHSL